MDGVIVLLALMLTLSFALGVIVGLAAAGIVIHRGE